MSDPDVIKISAQDLRALARLARELRVSAEPLDLDLGARTEES
jgi:hypothetical protein